MIGTRYLRFLHSEQDGAWFRRYSTMRKQVLASNTLSLGVQKALGCGNLETLRRKMFSHSALAVLTSLYQNLSNGPDHNQILIAIYRTVFRTSVKHPETQRSGSVQFPRYHGRVYSIQPFVERILNLVQSKQYLTIHTIDNGKVHIVHEERGRLIFLQHIRPTSFPSQPPRIRYFLRQDPLP